MLECLMLLSAFAVVLLVFAWRVCRDLAAERAKAKELERLLAAAEQERDGKRMVARRGIAP